MPCREVNLSKRSIAADRRSGNGQGTPDIRSERPRKGFSYIVVSRHMGHADTNEQSLLWTLVYATLSPKANETENGCLNRLTNERRPGVPPMHLAPGTALVSREHWLLERLRTLDKKHEKYHDFDDGRPLVVIDLGERKLLVDGNHRVTRWLMKGDSRPYEVLLIRHSRVHT